MSEDKIRVTQVRSPIGRSADQRKTLIGLGLNKIRRSRELEDTPAVRGMINKLNTLLKWKKKNFNCRVLAVQIEGGSGLDETE